MVNSIGAQVGPRFSWVSINEETASSTNSKVEDEVEFLIERSVLGSVRPWIVIRGGVPSSTFPEGDNASVNIKKSDSVNICSDVGWAPFKSEGVEVISKGSSVGQFVGSRGEWVSVLWPVRTPMECAEDSINTFIGWMRGVSTAFHDVDFTTCRPFSIVVGFGEHPNCRPEPVTFGKLCSDFDLSVLDVEGLDGSETSTLDWVKVVSSSTTGSFATIEGVSSAEVGW